MKRATLLLALLLLSVFATYAAKSKKDPLSDLTQITDAKSAKKALKVSTNLMILATPSISDVKTSTAAEIAKAAASSSQHGDFAFVDCGESKKACRQLKIDPKVPTLYHFSQGQIHEEYGRSWAAGSLQKYMQDPTAPAPWQEDPAARDVVHVDARTFYPTIEEGSPTLVMVYAPWCPHCQNMKPDFSQAATHLKGDVTFVGFDADSPEAVPIRQKFNVSGFPKILYFDKGEFRFSYEGERTFDGIVRWLQNPQAPLPPPPEWTEIETDVLHLSSENFDDVVSSNPSILVMMYAPWCGHCKRMKPAYMEAASSLKQEGVPGSFAAIDATQETEIAEEFQVKGYPTLLYFRDGRFERKYEGGREKHDLVAFMKEMVGFGWPSAVEELHSETFDDFASNSQVVILKHAGDVDEDVKASFVAAAGAVDIPFGVIACDEDDDTRDICVELSDTEAEQEVLLIRYGVDVAEVVPGNVIRDSDRLLNYLTETLAAKEEL